MTSAPPQLGTRDLTGLGDAYGWGVVASTRFITAGVMNHNWQVTTSRGRYAVKRLLDVDPDTARRNLRTLEAVAATGFPACAPLRTRAADLVCHVGDRAYTVLPWIDGHHPHGTELTTAQVRQFGTLVAQLHDVLNRVGPGAGLGPAAAHRPHRPSPRATHCPM